MKKDWIRIAAVVVVVGAVLQAADQKPATDWRTDLLEWRAKREKGLQAPEGWLSLVALGWLKEGDNAFGSANDCRVQITGNWPAHIAVFRLEKGSVKLLPPAEGFPKNLQVDGAVAKETAVIDDTADKPTKLSLGSMTVIVINRDGQFALRVKDLNAPTRTGFHGLKWYDPDEKYLVKAKWIPYDPPKTLDIPTILGTITHMPAPGVAEFTVDGQTVRLEPVLEDPKATDLFFIMRDTTSKTTTYGAGRFLYTGFPDHGLSQPGEIVLDFNRLFNPPCAFTAFATCPLPPPQNRLPVAIPAGEKKYHE